MKDFYERIDDIKKMPTLFEDAEKGPSHESVLKSYNIVNFILEMLKENLPSDYIIQTILECQDDKCTNGKFLNGKVFIEAFKQMVPCQQCRPDEYLEFLESRKNK